jgi:hypothetical protein
MGMAADPSPERISMQLITEGTDRALRNIPGIWIGLSKKYALVCLIFFYGFCLLFPISQAILYCIFL